MDIYGTLVGIYPYVAILAALLFTFFAFSAWKEKGFRAAIPDIRNNLLAAVAVCIVMPALLGLQTLAIDAVEAGDVSIFTDQMGLGGYALMYLRWPLALITLALLLVMWFSPNKTGK